jgi:hypothetical protein
VPAVCTRPQTRFVAYNERDTLAEARSGACGDRLEEPTAVSPVDARESDVEHVTRYIRLGRHPVGRLVRVLRLILGHRGALHVRTRRDHADRLPLGVETTEA